MNFMERLLMPTVEARIGGLNGSAAVVSFDPKRPSTCIVPRRGGNARGSRRLAAVAVLEPKKHDSGEQCIFRKGTTRCGGHIRGVDKDIAAAIV